MNNQTSWESQISKHISEGKTTFRMEVPNVETNVVSFENEVKKQGYNCSLQHVIETLPGIYVYNVSKRDSWEDSFERNVSEGNPTFTMRVDNEWGDKGETKARFQQYVESRGYTWKIIGELERMPPITCYQIFLKEPSWEERMERNESRFKAYVSQADIEKFNKSRITHNYTIIEPVMQLLVYPPINVYEIQKQT